MKGKYTNNLVVNARPNKFGQTVPLKNEKAQTTEISIENIPTTSKRKTNSMELMMEKNF